MTTSNIVILFVRNGNQNIRSSRWISNRIHHCTTKMRMFDVGLFKKWKWNSRVILCSRVCALDDFPRSSSLVCQLRMKCITNEALAVTWRGVKPPESSIGASKIVFEVLRLKPHISLILGRVFRLMERSCFLDRKDWPRGCSTEGLKTLSYKYQM